MAVTKIHAIKGNVKKSIDYIKNPDKTDGMLLVDGISCAPEIADIMFKMTKDYFGKTEGNQAYHLIQSFKPGEVSEEKAHEIGMKLAEKVCREKFEAIVATHIDKGHIHNHIIINSVSHITGEKYNDCKNSYREIRSHSDELCLQYGLNVIINPKEKGKSYKEWSECRQGSSWKEAIRNDVDKAIKNCISFEDFLIKMQEKEYSIKQGKYISFKPHKKDRFVRGKTLGADYSEEAIKAKIALKQMGYTVSKYAEGVKVYKNTKSNKKSFYTTKLFKGRKSLLETNILLAALIIKELVKKKETNHRNDFSTRQETTTNGSVKSLLRRKHKEISQAKLQRLADQLRFIRSEKIASIKELDELTSTTESKLKNARQEIKKLENDAARFNEIYKAIISFNNNKPFYDDVSKSIFKKRKQNKYEVELRTFEYSKQKLQGAGIKSDTDIEQFLNIHQVHMEKVKRINKDYKALKERLESCKLLKKTIRNFKENKLISRESEKERVREKSRELFR